MSAILFLLLGVEFIAIVILTVYVGAISVLFLFVVMLLNLRIVELYSMFFSYFSVGWFIFIFCALVFFIILGYDYSVFKSVFFLDDNYFNLAEAVGYTYNLAYLGSVLYNGYGHLVVLASLILLIAMIGSIVLTVDYLQRTSLKDVYLHEVLVENNSVSFFKFK
jgi:NADH-quinone oxidoreductase subunit J